MTTDTPEILTHYRHQLHDAIDRDLARSHRPARLKRRALVVGLPATAAAAATAAVVLLSAGGAEGPAAADAAILRHVRTELTAPAGSILHEAATVTLTDGTSTHFELWTQTGTGVYRVIKFGHEASQSATLNETYDASTDTVTISPLPAQIHALEVSRDVDLAGELKQMADSGQATATPTTYDGTPAYELHLPAGSQPVLNGTAYVAQSDYRPLEIDSRLGKVAFSTYEYLSATPANDALLSVTAAHPGAKVVTEAGNG